MENGTRGKKKIRGYIVHLAIVTFDGESCVRPETQEFPVRSIGYIIFK